MNRRALVTGAGARVGRRIAVELARHGFHVAVHYRGSRKGAETTLKELKSVGGDGWLVQADLGVVESCRKLVAEVAERWDGLEALVNNASMFDPVPFEQITVDHWEQMQAVNVRAPFLLAQGLLPQLRNGKGATGAQDGEGGVVVNIVDIGADRPVSGYAHYSVSKAGLAMLVKAMAVELAPAVRCVGVSPGQVMWPPDYSEERRARLASRIPMKRRGDGEDIARLVRFLVTEAPYINAEIVAVDGGLSARY